MSAYYQKVFANSLLTSEKKVYIYVYIVPRYRIGAFSNHLSPPHYAMPAGFLVQKESIDVTEQTDPTKQYIPSQTIDIYLKGWNEPDLPSQLSSSEHVERIDNEALYNMLQPWIPKITQIVKDNRNHEEFIKLYPNEPDRDPELNWIFFRKYSPSATRNSLKHHVDTNMNTVNIELSNDYIGGGLFYIKPYAKNGSINEEYYSDTKNGYEWLDSVKRVNSSDMIFPDLRAGDAIFYNYTVRVSLGVVCSLSVMHIAM